MWFRRTFLPSLAIERSGAHIDNISKGKDLQKELADEIDICKEMITAARKQRLIMPLQVPLGSDGTYGHVKQYYDRILVSNGLKSHLTALELELSKVKFMASTQAAADLNGYRGLADWAESALKNHECFATTVAEVSFVGAGLTYGTIFSASRGNISLMCYAFALFCMGFIIPVITALLLGWASRRPPGARFASPRKWKVLLCLFHYVTVLAVAAAICVLNVTIFQLRFTIGDHGEYRDSPPQFNTPVRPAAIMTLVCIGIVSLTAAIAFTLHYTVNGWSTLFDSLLDRRDRGPGLNEYLPV